VKWRERGQAEGVEWGNTYGPSAFLVEGIGANVPPDQMRGPSEHVHIVLILLRDAQKDKKSNPDAR
jgi:hypothetical protein